MNLRRRVRKWIAYAILLIPFGALAADPLLVDIAIAKRKPEGGVRTVKVQQGDAVKLRVRSDEALEVHVHGYDVKMKIAAGASASVQLAAKLVGRFPVTAHLHPEGGKSPEPTLLYLEVHPR